MAAQVYEMRRSIQRMVCIGCGAEANAACNCGKAYVPAAQRVAKYDEANPGKSTREAAADLGVSHETVSKARKSGASLEAPVNQLTPATVTGRDGKSYARKRIIDRDEEDYNAVNRRRVFDRCAADVIRKAEQGAGLIDASGLEIDDEVLATLDRVINIWTALRDTLIERRNDND